MEAETQPNQLTDAELIERVDDALRLFLDRRFVSSLNDAIEYSVFSGGKRVRPVLCLRSCLAVGGDLEKALPAAVAIELIHTFSLVHDDLPGMDDDDLRRGRPTLHKHTNEAMAILAGDAMLTYAFQVLASSQVESDTLVKLIGWLSAFTNTMIIGQVYDTMGGYSEEMDPIEQLRETHSSKTGALLHASIVMGAYVGGATDDQHTPLAQYADAIGLMFQAVDDLLDVTQSTEKMGKATGKDAGQGKLTYPGLLGIDGTRAEIDKLLSRALEALSGFDAKADPLREMAQRLATRQH
ncbi:MAG: polyprenyl synthetase family protein [Phycisphaeraceae bacterium]|nr:polyprenyl synthetase family protein [Phycisphaeraceae bacterium]